MRIPFAVATALCLTTLLPAPIRAESAASDQEAPPKTRIAKIRIGGPIFEKSPPLSLFGGAVGTSLRDLVTAIRAARDDDRTSALWIELKDPAASLVEIEALRRELIGFRASGKPSYCHVEAAGNAAYLIASACSEVSMLPTGVLELPGLTMGRMYMRSLLEKLGIEFQELRMGRYKSAVEGYTRDGASDPVREEAHAILDELFDRYVAAIAENRSLGAVDVRALVDRAVFVPEDARAARLVDHVEYEDEFLARATRGREVVEVKLGKKLDLEVGGFAGMMALMNEIFAGPRKVRASKAPKLAIVTATGAIVSSMASGGLFSTEAITSDEMVKILRELREDETVKAVVLRVDSPGGSALASDLIWREVSLTVDKKPVVVSMGSLAASGGYYISCAANWIVADPSTLTGSIGVIGAVPNLRRLHDKIGVSYETFHRGKRAALVSPYGEVSEEGRDLLMGYMKKIYDDFLDRVAKGRGLTRESVAAIAEGRVWTGARAKELGLVDELGGLDAAIAKARSLGSVPDDAEVLELPREKNLFELLSEMGALSLALRTLAAELPGEVKSLLHLVEWVRCAETEKVFLVAPRLFTVR